MAVAELQRRLAPPTGEWLAGRIAVFLSHFYTPNESPEEAAARMDDWLDVLDGCSQAAVAEACTRILRQPGRKRPMPGEVFEIASGIDRESRAAIAKRQPQPAIVHHLTEDEIKDGQERRWRGISDLAEKFPHLIKRVE